MSGPMRTFEDAWAAVADVDGWMTRGQGEALYEAAHKEEDDPRDGKRHG